MAEQKEKSEKKDKDKEKDKEKQPLTIKKVVILMSLSFLLIIIITIVSLVLILKDDPESNVEDQQIEQQVTKQDKVKASNDNKSEEQATTDNSIEVQQSENDQTGLRKPAIFYSIKPVFVVNLNSSRVKFLQVRVDIMTRDQETVKKITDNLPLIKNELLILFSNKNHDEVKTLEGREALRRQALKIVRDVLNKETGNAKIEDVLFTGFVMQ